MSALRRNNVQVSGVGSGRPIVFAHGFGCDQQMWRFVAPHFEDDHRIVLFDHVGCGGSDVGAYDADAYSSLDRYASDILEIVRELELREIVFVGHSVSAMMGLLASIEEPDRFAALVLVGPSPRYIDDGDYVGGFTADDISELLTSLESNYLGWSRAMAPSIMGNPERPELGAELADTFCRVDPAIAKQFARVTFLGDNRADLRRVSVPTLVIQCADDVIAPPVVGAYVAERIPDSKLEVLEVSGHCPNMSAPHLTAQAIRSFVDRLPAAV